MVAIPHIASLELGEGELAAFYIYEGRGNLHWVLLGESGFGVLGVMAIQATRLISAGCTDSMIGGGGGT